jgi:hypothetical protein
MLSDEQPLSESTSATLDGSVAGGNSTASSDTHRHADDDAQHIDTTADRKRKRCEVCSSEIAKYRCPRCSMQTCSLTCVNMHKSRFECSGLANVTSFVPLSEFDENLLLQGTLNTHTHTKYTPTYTINRSNPLSSNCAVALTHISWRCMVDIQFLEEVKRHAQKSQVSGVGKGAKRFCPATRDASVSIEQPDSGATNTTTTHQAVESAAQHTSDTMVHSETVPCASATEAEHDDGSIGDGNQEPTCQSEPSTTAGSTTTLRGRGGRGRGAPRSRSGVERYIALLPQALSKLVRSAERKGVQLAIMPHGMSRRNINRSIVEFK